MGRFKTYVSREGFRRLYDEVSGPKPPFEEVWRLAGGNPDKFAELHGNGWRAEDVVKNLVIKGLTAEAVRGEVFGLARL